jgi:RNA polymerase sigma-70 factor (ECF subfamily)
MEKDKKIDNPADQVLIGNYLAGSNADFNVLYERYKRQLYAYLHRMLPGQHAVIDDIFQQVWIKVIAKLPVYQHNNKFQAWLLRIAHNMTIDFFRRSKKNITVSVDNDDTLIQLPDCREMPWSELCLAELSTAVATALEELPIEQKEVFLLRQDKISFKEIAAIQQCSINTALGRMKYAIKNLRKELDTLL